MSKKQRTILFTLSIIIFILTIPMVVFYTRGYRVDFTEWDAVQTGGIALSPNPIGVEVYVDGKFKEETSFLFRNAIFRNILPRTYHIRVAKEGYQKWEKFLTVEEGQVTQVPSLRLFPENPQFTILREDIQTLMPSPDTKYALALILVPLQEASTSGEEQQKEKIITHELVLIELNKNTSRAIVSLGAGEGVGRLVWSENSEYFIVETVDAKGKHITTGSIKNDELVRWDTLLAALHPEAYEASSKLRITNSPNDLWVFSRTQDGGTGIEPAGLGLTRADHDRNSLDKNIITGIRAFSIKNGNLYYVSAGGLLTKANLSGSPIDTLSPTVIADASRTNFDLMIRDDEKAILATVDDILYLWEENLPIQKITTTAGRGAFFGYDREKFLYWDEAKIVVQWTKEIFGPPKRLVGDQEIISEFSGIENVIWIDVGGSYFALQQDSRIIVAELDSRDRRNTALFEMSTSPDLFVHDTATQLIYTLISGRLVAITLE